MKYIKEYPGNSNSIYQFSVFRYKVDGKLNEPSLSDFKCYVKNVKNIWLD